MKYYVFTNIPYATFGDVISEGAMTISKVATPDEILCLSELTSAQKVKILKLMPGDTFPIGDKGTVICVLHRSLKR